MVGEALKGEGGIAAIGKGRGRGDPAGKAVVHEVDEPLPLV